jgi:hypothetical protein
VDWVVKKELELTNLGPIGGDELTIRRQQVSASVSPYTLPLILSGRNVDEVSLYFKEETRVLRRQLFDKRPIIENKLLSGRQFLASEPTPSDTSDSDSKSQKKELERQILGYSYTR